MASSLLAARATTAVLQVTQRQALTLQFATAPTLTLALLVSQHVLKGDTLQSQMAWGELGSLGVIRKPWQDGAGKGGKEQ